MKKTFGIFLFSFVVLIGSLLSCNPNGVVDDDTLHGGLKFDLTGAKAIGTVESTASHGVKDAADAFELAKILEDGTIQAALKAPDGAIIPDISFIAKSPTADGLFICFSNQLWFSYPDDSGEWVNETCGPLIYIEPNGKYYDALPSDPSDPYGNSYSVQNYSWYGNDDFKPIVFDAAGNAYFIASTWANSSSVSVVYKYDITSHEVSNLTPIIESFSYESIDVSADGNYIFVKGSRYTSGASTNFFRVYPTNGTSDPANIFYSSNSDVWVAGYKTPPIGSYVVVTGYNIRGISGILRVDVSNLSSIAYTPLYNSDTSNFSPIYYTSTAWDNKVYAHGLFTQNQADHKYYFDAYWHVDHDVTKPLDIEAIDSYIGQYFIEPAEFRFADTSGDMAYQAVEDQGLSLAEIGGSYDDYFLRTNYYNPKTGTNAVTLARFKEENGISWFYFTDVQNMFFDTDGSLWGLLRSNNKPIPVKLLNSEGERDLSVVNVFSGDTYNPVGFVMDDGYIYFRDGLVDAGGYETGYHRMMRFSIHDDDPIVSDVLQNVPRNGSFEIVDYSAGGGFLYFTGATLSGEVLGGRVNLSTLAYEPFDATYRLSNIEVY